MPDQTPREQLAKLARNVLESQTWHSPAAVAIALVDDIAAEGWRPPARVIATVEDIATLPVGSILVDHEGDSWQLFARGWRCPASESGWSDWSDNWLDATDVVQVAPLTLLHTPENGDTE